MGKKNIRYSFCANSVWTEDIVNFDDLNSEEEVPTSIFGEAITGLAIDGCKSYKYRTIDGWTEEFKTYDDGRNHFNIAPILEIDISEDNIEIRVHIKGGMWMDFGNKVDISLPIDGLQIIEK